MINRRMATGRRTLSRRIVATVAALGLLAGGSVMMATTASAAGQEVCSGYDSGKIDTTGDPKSVTVTAPEGKLISGYCVKAGSDKSVPDGAVVWVPVDPAAKTVTITHPSGKAVSHYALAYVDAPTFTGKASGDGSMTICYGGKTTIVTWSASTTATAGSQEAADQKAKDALPAALTAAKNTELAKYPGYIEGACKDDVPGSATGSGSMTICTGGASISISWTATTTSSGADKATADANAALLLPAALTAAKNAELAKYPGYTEGTCAGTVEAKASGSDSLAICVADQELTASWSATVTGFGADAGAAEADAQSKLPAALDAARTAELAKYAGYTEGGCEPTQVVTPQAATVARPAPATVAVPAAATLPAAVPAGEGSDTGLPMWALAMVAAGMIGAAFAGKQLLGARK